MSKSINPIFLVIGTRPEAIKMAPIYHALREEQEPVYVCATMQHDQLSRDVFDLFSLKPDVELNIMRSGQDLFYLTHAVLLKVKEILIKIQPSLVLVQGDTTSAMAAALAAFYLHIPIMHIEAGLRTYDMQLPFPEEMNRQFISLIAAYHCAPTKLAVEQLHVIPHINKESIFFTGNTVVDALRMMQEKIACNQVSLHADFKNKIQECLMQNKKILVLTMHRRELTEEHFFTVLVTIKQLILSNHDFVCFYVYHPNPIILHMIERADLYSIPTMHLYEPLDYPHMVYLLSQAHIVLTDSGGLQEEAISLGKQVIVLREKTERMEGVYAGRAHLVGTSSSAIKAAVNHCLQSLDNRCDKNDVYGDGYAAKAIVSLIKNNIQKKDTDTIVQTVPFADAKYITDAKGNLFMKKVMILGLGYIGLPTAVIAADHGLDVIGFDVDTHKIQRIHSGDPIIQEPSLYEKLHYVMNSGNLKVTSVMQGADYFIIAVPTPITEDKKADISYVISAAQLIASVIVCGNTVILESTVPVGTTEQIAHIIEQQSQLRSGIDFFVAHCPERVLPGNIIQELIENDRIIGGINEASLEQAKLFYKTFVTGCLYLTDLRTAEMVKLIENSYRDVQLAFAHQVASMAYATGLDPYDLITLANKHPRVNILKPTVGVGGHCIAVDPWFLVESFPEQTHFIKTARQINDAKPYEILKLINQAVDTWRATHDNRTCTVFLMGATYKPDVDDMRESPALHIIKQCIKDQKMKVLVCEPMVKTVMLKNYLSGVTLLSAMEGIAAADIIVFLVCHQRFRALDRKLFNDKKVLDFCGVFYEEKKMVYNEATFWPAQSLFFSPPLYATMYEQKQD